MSSIGTASTADETVVCQLNLIQDYSTSLTEVLAESSVLDVCVNAGGAIWVNRLGEGWRHSEYMSASAPMLLLQAIATHRGLELNASHPVLETTFPLSGDRIEGVIPPVVTEPILALRTRTRTIFTLADYAAQGVLTREGDSMNVKREREQFLDHVTVGMDHAEVLSLSTRFRQNILLVGPTGSGKTSFANAIMADWAAQTPDDRVVIIEDTPELQCSCRNHVQMLATEFAALEKLLQTALRLIPKRIVVGEVRAPGPTRTLLEAWNTGHRGGLATIHADDARSGLLKIESLLGAHSETVREQIAAAVGLVIFIEGDDRVAAGRKVREILAVKGFNPGRKDYELVRL